MKRVFWIALGATAGVLVVRKLTKTVDQYSPEGIGRSLSNLADAVRDAAEVVREAMDEREAELRVALGVDSGQLSRDEAAELLENPTGNRGDR